MSEQEYTYAKAMARLEDILQQVQSGNVEEIDSLYGLLKESEELIRFCRARLYDVDTEVQNLFGSITEENL